MNFQKIWTLSKKTIFFSIHQLSHTKIFQMVKFLPSIYCGKGYSCNIGRSTTVASLNKMVRTPDIEQKTFNLIVGKCLWCWIISWRFSVSQKRTWRVFAFRFWWKVDSIKTLTQQQKQYSDLTTFKIYKKNFKNLKNYNIDYRL